MADDEKSTDPNLRPPLHGGDVDGSSSCSWILLDVFPYIADRVNSTSAEAKMSGGGKIRITLCAAPPPLVSYVCVWCPGRSASHIDYATLDAAGCDLLLLRVSLKSGDPVGEFFVYKASASNGRPSLRPLQVPRELLIRRYHIGLLAHSDVAGARPREEEDGGGGSLLSHGEGLRSHGGGTVAGFDGLRSHGPGGGIRLRPYLDGRTVRFRPHDNGLDHYFVAALLYKIKSSTEESSTFNLWVYNSTDDKWITSPFTLHARPHPRQRTSKVIVLGQGGQLAFVDPWRGIVICDVLGCTPPSYLPLPKEISVRTTWSDEAQIVRDVTLIDGRFILCGLCYLGDESCSTWQVFAWSKGVFSEEEWRHDYEVPSREILIDDDTENASLLPRIKDGEGLLRPTLEGLYIAHPILSLTGKGHVVYIMAKVGRDDTMALLLSVDTRKKKLQAVSMFNAERMFDMFNYTYTQSRIPGYFNAGAKGNLKRPGHFNVRYPFKLQDRINMTNGADDEQQDNIMDLD